MPFPYRYICDLLQRIEDEICSKKTQKVPSRVMIQEWFQEHRLRLDAPTVDASAVLSILLPERRTDRVYRIQATKLEGIIGRALTLGHSRVKELRRYKIPGQGVDLGRCVEEILKRTPNPSRKDEVTVEEIDDALGRIAASCRNSSPAVRAQYRAQDQQGQNSTLADFYARLSARDAKWLTRLVLKNYEPIVLKKWDVLKAYHVLLPQMMMVRDDLTVATPFLEEIRQSSGEADAVASIIKPVLGTKVGRQPWLKARSINECLDMGRRRQISCEQKLDGEYCQIHIDMQKPRCIQIFSKSGKDSTEDRKGLHRAIRESLRLGNSDCPIKVGCILEEKEQKILPFHKIRKYVSRSGSFLGTSSDSPPAHDHDHLMIVYYDILMIDDKSLLGMRQSERFQHLEKLFTCREGRAELVKRQVISLSSSDAASVLRNAFARCIVARREGLVLKPDDPYFDFTTQRRPFTSCNIKLKKEYVQGWGDVGDFAVIGASYDAAKARTYKIPNLKWTHFFIGCLMNKELAEAKSARPKFMVTNIVDLSESLLTTVMPHFSRTIPLDDNQSLDLDFRGIGNVKEPTVIFPEPLVFDMRSFSFDKEPNTRSWSMRFPIVTKIHFDRSYLDTIAYDELQEAARVATEASEVEDHHEMQRWISALEKADPRGVPVDAISQESWGSEDMATPTKNAEERSRCLESLAADEGHTRDSLAFMTPPRSSAVKASNMGSFSTPESQKISGALNIETPTNKKQRTAPSTDVLATPRPALSEPSQMEGRAPLGAIDGNSSAIEKTCGFPPGSSAQGLPRLNADLPAQDEVGIPSSVTGSFHTANELPSSPPNENHRPSNKAKKEGQVDSETSKQEVQQSSCGQRGDKCKLANIAFLLSPCISKYGWVTENLLRSHGITSFATEPETWNQVLALQGVSDVDATGQTVRNGEVTPQSTQKKRLRKICLVEAKRKEQTEAFMRRIGESNLKRRNGDREWIKVYDWKLLEDIAHEEAGLPCEVPTPWRSRYLGLA